MTKLKKIPSTILHAPLIHDSVTCFECKLRTKVGVGIHTTFISEILMGRISEYTKKLHNPCTWPVSGADGFKTISELSSEDIKEAISSGMMALQDAKKLKKEKEQKFLEP